MISLTLPPYARPAALFALQRVIEMHQDLDGEQVVVHVGEREIHLGVEMRVTGSSACLTDLFRLLDVYAPQ